MNIATQWKGERGRERERGEIETRRERKGGNLV